MKKSAPKDKKRERPAVKVEPTGQKTSPVVPATDDLSPSDRARRRVEASRSAALKRVVFRSDDQ